MDISYLLTFLVTFFLPPLGVAIKIGFGIQFWINVILTLLGHIPGVIHGMYVVLKKSPAD
jgi:uncharacterized membrane protein YqaE (UPF0057 family)